MVVTVVFVLVPGAGIGDSFEVAAVRKMAIKVATVVITIELVIAVFIADEVVTMIALVGNVVVKSASYIGKTIKTEDNS